MKYLKFFIVVVSFGSYQTSAAEVTVSDITYMAPWTPHVDVKMATGFIDPE